ncbi:hypothetical protein [Phenylobacterium zucineum]|uniref:hypothetical protein n=1 Tax=Phenylobacterium zucineum TaxID=284016 RepID=UPI0002F1D57D|nr:hypothetical protein [Phenylobacterium zucineum]
MRRRSLFSLLTALVLGACAHPVTPLAVGPEMSWGLTESPDEAKLAFGQEGTDNVVLMLACQPRSGQVLVSLVALERRERPTLILKAGEASTRHPAVAEPNMITDGFIVEATTGADDPALRSFAAGEPLTVGIGGRRTHLPAAPAVGRRFVESCRAA